MNSLFRREAIDHASNRLAGNVILATPLSVRVLGAGFAAIIAGAIVFSAMATYARKATVTGWLSPDRGMVRIAARANGSISHLLLKEGAPVKAGDRIAEIALSSETSSGDVGMVIASSLATEAEAAKIRAAAAIVRLRRETIDLGVRRDNIAAQLGQARTQTGLQAQRLALARQELSRGEELIGKGLVSRRDYDNRRSQALSIEEDLAGQSRQAFALQREIDDVTARLGVIPVEIAISQADAETASASLRQRVAESQARDRLFVTAPIDGRIAAIPVSSGQSVTAGTTVAVITPLGGRLEAELLAPSRAIGFITPGQEVRLQLQAFPHQRFGLERGTVRTVSATVLAPSEVSIPGLEVREPVFRVRVSLDRDYVEAYGTRIPMQAGMLLSADIVFDRRSLVEWLFDPIYAVRHRS